MRNRLRKERFYLRKYKMNRLLRWRLKIDKINSQILNLVAKRTKITNKIGKYKKQKNIPIYDPKREKEIHRKMGKLSKQKDLNPKFIKKLFNLIIIQAKKDMKMNL